MKKLAFVLAATLTAAALIFIPSWGEGELGQMKVREIDGDVVIARAGQRIAVEGTASLKPGDEVYVVDETGVAMLRLAGERRADLSPDARVKVLDEESLEVASGSIKAETDGDTMSVTFDEVTVTNSIGRASFRVDQGFGYGRAGVYRGGISLAKPGEPSVTVEELFEATTTGGDLPLGTRPYSFREDDPWDQAELAAVITLDQDLERSAASVASQLGNTRPGLDYFRALAKSNVRFMKPFMQRKVGDLLIAFTVADNSSGSLAAALRRSFQLHDQGGEWGIVATIMEARPNALLADLGSIVLATGVADGGQQGQGQLDFSLAAAQEAGSPTTDQPGGGDTPGGSDPGGGGDPGGGNNGGGQPPEEPQDCQNGAECDIQEGIDEVCTGVGVCPTESPGGEENNSDGPLTEGILGDGGLPTPERTVSVGEVTSRAWRTLSSSLKTMQA